MVRVCTILVYCKTLRGWFKGKDQKGLLEISLRHLLHNKVEMSGRLLDI